MGKVKLIVGSESRFSLIVDKLPSPDSSRLKVLGQADSLSNTCRSDSLASRQQHWNNTSFLHIQHGRFTKRRIHLLCCLHRKKQ